MLKYLMDEIYMRCKAKNRAKEQCGRHAVPGYQVCASHGGKTPRGIASSRFTHGRYSKDLPARLVERYQEAAQDPELLQLRDEIAVVNARICDLLTRLDTGESGSLWRSLQADAEKLVECRRRGDSSGLADALNSLLEVIRQGHEDYQVWDEIFQSFELMRRLVDTETKRLSTMKQFISVEQVVVMMAALLESVKRNVADKSALAAIARDFDALAARADG